VASKSNLERVFTDELYYACHRGLTKQKHSDQKRRKPDGLFIQGTEISSLMLTRYRDDTKRDVQPGPRISRNSPWKSESGRRAKPLALLRIRSHTVKQREWAWKKRLHHTATSAKPNPADANITLGAGVGSTASVSTATNLIDPIPRGIGVVIQLTAMAATGPVAPERKRFEGTYSEVPTVTDSVRRRCYRCSPLWSMNRSN